MTVTGAQGVVRMALDREEAADLAAILPPPPIPLPSFP
jgi:hypothetical protein